MPKGNIPKSVVKRLPVYLRILDRLVLRDIEIVSSKELSSESGFTAEQIRKDLAYFGAFGTRGTGYTTHYLREQILKIIGLDKKTNIIVVGGGHLGTSLTRYNTIKNPYVNIVAVLENDPDLIGQEIESTPVIDNEDARPLIKEHNIKVAILTVPATSAQEATEHLVELGIKAILNFAPIKLKVPEGVHVFNSDLTMELQSLIYYSSAEEERKERLQAGMERKDD